MYQFVNNKSLFTTIQSMMKSKTDENSIPGG